MANKKIAIIISIIIVVVVAIVSILIIVNRLNSTDIDNDWENEVPGNANSELTGKLAEYIKSLSDNYNIKYSGNFKNDLGQKANTIVEYTKNGENFALRISELDVHLICEGAKLYSISNKYEVVVQMSRASYNISEYNLASNIGQTYVKSYKSKVENEEYDVEEYTYNNEKIKYYFQGKDLKFIRYKSEDIKVVRVEKNVYTTLFNKPEGYKYI